MPPDGKLADGDIAVLTRWIKMGAPWPELPTATAAGPPKEKINDEDRAFWSFQPVRRPPVPRRRRRRLVRNPIDRFIFAEARIGGPAAGPRGRSGHADPPRHLRPDRPAADAGGGRCVRNPQSAIRSPQSKRSSTACSPARATASAGPGTGSTSSATPSPTAIGRTRYRPDAWRYRDYVIRAFNDDKPYDRFVAEQLAGDELAPDDPDGPGRHRLPAAGHLRVQPARRPPASGPTSSTTSPT